MEGTRRRGRIPEFLSQWRVRLVGGVWVSNSSATNGLTLFSDEPHHKRFGSPFTIDFLLGGNRVPYNKLGAHFHNWTGGSQMTTKGPEWPQKVLTTKGHARNRTRALVQYPSIHDWRQTLWRIHYINYCCRKGDKTITFTQENMLAVETQPRKIDI